MPRDGSGNYTLPYPAVVDGTTIESAVHNGTMSDIALQLNGPVPIIAGGTGANNAAAAMVNLNGEVARQIVTNYDTHPFVAGSFYSSPGATGEPVAGGYFTGICSEINSSSMYLEGRQLGGTGTEVMYVRRKWGAVWDPWKQLPGSVADLDARYVNLTGDTMTGALTVSGSGSDQLLLNAVGGSYAVARWQNSAKVYQLALDPLNNFNIYDETRGTAALRIEPTVGAVSIPSTNASTSPTTGALTVAGGVGIGGNINAGGSITSGPAGIIAGSNGFYSSSGGIGVTTGNFSSTAASTSYATGALTVAGGVGIGGKLVTAGSAFFTGSITTAPNSTSGQLYFGLEGGNRRLTYDGTKYEMTVAPLNLTATTPSTSSTTGALTVAGGVGVTGAIVAGGSIDAGGTTGSVSTPNFVMKNGANSYLTADSASTILQFFNAGAANYMVSTRATGVLTYVSTTTSFTANGAGDLQIYGAGIKPGGGSWTATSDARVKNELGDYTRGLAEIAQLRPVYYTYKGNDTLEAPAYIKTNDPEADAKLVKEPLAVPYPNSQHVNPAKAETKFAGLIAQEVEAIIPEMVTKRSGYIDGAAVEDMRDLDTTPLIFALINSVKELKAKVEALEAR